jgi:hypothetical protein
VCQPPEPPNAALGDMSPGVALVYCPNISCSREGRVAAGIGEVGSGTPQCGDHELEWREL